MTGRHVESMYVCDGYKLSLLENLKLLIIIP